MILGAAADVLNILMYAGPLTIMSTVIRTKSIEYMPLALTLGTTFCSTAWLGYGFCVSDVAILIPNAGGAFLSLCQIVLYCCYCNTLESRRAIEKVRGWMKSQGNS